MSLQPSSKKKVKKAKKQVKQVERQIHKDDIPYLTFVLKPKNKQLLIKALQHVCLAGPINRKKLNRVVDTMDLYEAGRFIILFKSSFGRQDFKALYAMESEDH